MEDLTYSQISFKASHNTYERTEDVAEQLTFNSNKPYNGGCMSLEFDIWRSMHDYTPGGLINEAFFRVFHSSPHVWPPLGKTLKYYLDKLLEWHRINPEHDARLIIIDIKSSGGGYNDFHHQIDAYLKYWFDESIIFKPKDMLIAHDISPDTSKTLCELVIEKGWPTLNSLKNKFIFCLSGNNEWKQAYATHDLLAERFCFTDKDMPDNDKHLTPPVSGNNVFFNFHICHANKSVWMKIIPAFYNKNLITRAYEANSEDNWNNCISSKVSAIATDKISNHQWAMVSENLCYKAK